MEKWILCKLTFSTNDYGETQVMNYLDNLPGSDITTAKGYTFNGNNFDVWQRPSGYGLLKSTNTDDYIDIIVIIWRVNSKVNVNDRSGYIQCQSRTKTVKQKIGFHERTYITIFNADGWDALRHEFGHSLLGPNAITLIKNMI
ncbi:MAG: hypothetical protein R6W78_02635 [Bacteroidales bacterium]